MARSVAACAFSSAWSPVWDPARAAAISCPTCVPIAWNSGIATNCTPGIGHRIHGRMRGIGDFDRLQRGVREGRRLDIVRVGVGRDARVPGGAETQPSLSPTSFA